MRDRARDRGRNSLSRTTVANRRSPCIDTRDDGGRRGTDLEGRTVWSEFKFKYTARNFATYSLPSTNSHLDCIRRVSLVSTKPSVLDLPSREPTHLDCSPMSSRFFILWMFCQVLVLESAVPSEPDIVPTTLTWIASGDIPLGFAIAWSFRCSE